MPVGVPNILGPGDWREGSVAVISHARGVWLAKVGTFDFRGCDTAPASCIGHELCAWSSYRLTGPVLGSGGAAALMCVPVRVLQIEA